MAVLSPNEQGRWHYWKNGGRADSYSPLVDNLLAQYGLPHSYIPDEVWAEDQTHHNSRTGKRNRKPAKEPGDD